MTHVVRRQYIHLEIEGTEAHGLAVQRCLSSVCQRELLPAFELVLDRSIPPDVYLSIERLEVDAGTISFERLEDQFVRAAAQTLERSLKEVNSSEEIIASHKCTKIRQQTEHQRLEEVFVYFLEHGTLPWSFHLQPGTSLEQSLLDAWQRNEDLGYRPLAATEHVRRTLMSATARKRLVRQFSLLFLQRFVSLLAPGAEGVIVALWDSLGSHGGKSPQTKELKRLLWEVLFTTVAAGRSVTSSGLVSEVWCAFPDAVDRRGELARFLAQHWPESTKKYQTDTAIQPELSMSDPLLSQDTPLARSTPHMRPDHKATIQSEPSFPLSDGSSRADREGHPDAREGIFIDNAGLVLLHPFVPQLFRTLHLSDGDRLVQPERTLGLLHFLVTGQTTAPEYELVLPKILCGLPLETVVEQSEALTMADQEEATSLLEAVVTHWTALKNTSPDGLRGSFLLRKGKVSRRESGEWLLQVESNSYDILLDQLPWGISTIKLPWMSHILWVEWR